VQRRTTLVSWEQAKGTILQAQVRSSKRKHGDTFQPTRQGSTSPARATISSDDGEDETTHLTWINTEIHEESKVL
jgi:hypothetical protein